MPLSYSPLRAVEDVGPNDATGAGSAGNHWKALNKLGVPPGYDPTEDGPPFMAFDASGIVERVRVENKPLNFALIKHIKLHVIQSTSGGTFDPASGFMEFGLAVYKGDNTTLIASTTAHIANDYDPANLSPDPDDPNPPYFLHQTYDLGAVNLDPTDVGDGLIIELDSTAADGWTGGGTWYVYHAWLEVQYTETVTVDSLVSGNSPISDTCVGYSPIGNCTGDSPIEDRIIGSSIFEETA